MIFLSLVSHGHGQFFFENKWLSEILQDNEVKVVIKNNCVDDVLLSFCNGNDRVILIDNSYSRGFGENNNINFDYCVNNLGATKKDFFFVINPDVCIDLVSIKELAGAMCIDGSKLATINLYRDCNFTEFDNSIRMYPDLFSFVSSFLFNENKTIIDKRKITCPTNVDWAAGSFLAFTVEHYQKINGFDPTYFMYCEDIDICYRSNKSHAVQVRYYPSIHAVHYAKHQNRKIFSRHFYWHLKSSLIFLMRCWLRK